MASSVMKVNEHIAPTSPSSPSPVPASTLEAEPPQVVTSS
jgi:hypothetical protein